MAKFTVDGKEFHTRRKSVVGAYLKGCVGKDAQYQLFKERADTRGDRQIIDQESVCVLAGDAFYTVPTAYFASAA